MTAVRNLRSRTDLTAYGAEEAGAAAAVAAMAEDDAIAEDEAAALAEAEAVAAAFSAAAAADWAATAEESAEAASFFLQADRPTAATALTASTRPKVLFIVVSL